MKICSICNKTTQSGYNRPNSLKRTKRKIKPNLQSKGKKLVCTKCLRNSNK